MALVKRGTFRLVGTIDAQAVIEAKKMNRERKMVSYPDATAELLGKTGR